jgi:hypothetical protein
MVVMTEPVFDRSGETKLLPAIFDPAASMYIYFDDTNKPQVQYQ